jgi:hypothetical protein
VWWASGQRLCERDADEPLSLVAGQDSNLLTRPNGRQHQLAAGSFCERCESAAVGVRPLGYELAGRGLSRYARSHSCSSATFSRPRCLAASRLFAWVSRRSVSKSVANLLGDEYVASPSQARFFIDNQKYMCRSCPRQQCSVTCDETYWRAKAPDRGRGRRYDLRRYTSARWSTRRTHTINWVSSMR